MGSAKKMDPPEPASKLAPCYARRGRIEPPLRLDTIVNGHCTRLGCYLEWKLFQHYSCHQCNPLVKVASWHASTIIGSLVDWVGLRPCMVGFNESISSFPGVK